MHQNANAKALSPLPALPPAGTPCLLERGSDSFRTSLCCGLETPALALVKVLKGLLCADPLQHWSRISTHRHMTRVKFQNEGSDATKHKWPGVINERRGERWALSKNDQICFSECDLSRVSPVGSRAIAASQNTFGHAPSWLRRLVSLSDSEPAGLQHDQEKEKDTKSIWGFVFFCSPRPPCRRRAQVCCLDGATRRRGVTGKSQRRRGFADSFQDAWRWREEKQIGKSF